MALAATAAVAGGTAAAAYLNARLRITDDIKQLLFEQKCRKSFEQAIKEDRLSLWYLFAAQVSKQPNSRCLFSRTTSYTWQETYDACARYAQFFLSQGVRPGEIVALYHQNSPEFMIIWMALWSIGCAPAMINYFLEGAALVHCLKISGAKIVVVDGDETCTQRVEPSRKDIEEGLNMKIAIHDDRLKATIRQLPAIVPDDSCRKGMQPSFPIALFYTSGTTGLPKGSSFPIQRCWMGGDHIKPVFGTKGGPDGDTWYISMPLFHASGGMNAYGCMVSGQALAIGKKFSVSNFWKDVHDADATVILYVGETARYLVNAPPDPYERKHRVRLMHGNGLRPDVWDKFRQRFGVPEVAEFFSATEGNIFLSNHNKGPWSANAVGADGFLKRWRRHNLAVPVAIDYESGEIYRDPKTGFAKRQPYSVGGEIVVPLANEKQWVGYWKNDAATEKKLIRNLFKQGDLYYRTGDALRRTDDGLWFFMDRLGDTYRWKSENVSTAEVSEVLGNYPGISEAVVYGVQLPNHDGRAGCAALLLESNARSNFDFDALLNYTRTKLPRYAVPLFLRLINVSLVTGNNKQNKVPLKTEGIELKKFGSKVEGGEQDCVLWLAPSSDHYVDFRIEDWQNLVDGKAKL